LVHLRSWHAAYRGLLPQEYLDQLDPADHAGRWRRMQRETDWATGGVLVAVRDGQVCGATWFGPTRDTGADRRDSRHLPTAGKRILLHAMTQ
jgi:hypothetical protein